MDHWSNIDRPTCVLIIKITKGFLHEKLHWVVLCPENMNRICYPKNGYLAYFQHTLNEYIKTLYSANYFPTFLVSYMYFFTCIRVFLFLQKCHVVHR